jgi:hypothetical protein
MIMTNYWVNFIILITFTIIIYSFLLTNCNDRMEHFTSDVLVFYVFYSDNCPHSQKFIKEQWNILREKYANKVVFNKINCGEESSKGMCKTFGVKSVPAICLAKENEKPIFFKGVRSLDNLEKFLNQHIELSNNNNHTEFFEKETEHQNQNKVKLPTINDLVEFEQNEDMTNKTYKYCIKYMDEEKKQFNHCQTINEKETPNLKSWQGSYSVVSDYLKRVTGKGNLADKKMVAFKNKDHLADWHLCDPILLQTIKSNVEKIGDKDDMDINTAIQYGCGFMK